MTNKKQSYLEEYRDFLNRDEELYMDNDLVVQINLGYMELNLPSFQPKPRYIQQELDLGIESPEKPSREIARHMEKLLELTRIHRCFKFPEECRRTTTVESIERQLEEYEI